MHKKRMPHFEIYLTGVMDLRVDAESGDPGLVPVTPFIGRRWIGNVRSELGIGVIIHGADISFPGGENLQEHKVLFQGGKIEDPVTLWRSMLLAGFVPEIDTKILLACYLCGSQGTPEVNVALAGAYLLFGGYSAFNDCRKRALSTVPPDEVIEQLRMCIAGKK